MSDRHDTNATESRVDLPGTVNGEFQVYINGILQQPGTDYVLDVRTLVFPRSLAPEVKMSKLQLLRAALGVAGTYGKHDSIDITYEHESRKLVATGLRARSSEPTPPR